MSDSDSSSHSLTKQRLMAAAHLLQTTAETLILAAEDCAPEVTELAAKLADANEQLEAARVRLKIPKGMKIVPNLRHRR